MALPKILLVDNAFMEGGSVSKRVLSFEEIFRSYPAEVNRVRFTELKEEDLDGMDALVLTGSSMNVSEDETKIKLKDVIRIVKNSEIPVLGVCFGFHLVMHAYGCTVKRNEDSTEFESPNGRIIEIEITRDDGILKQGKYKVNVAHRDYVEPTDPALVGNFLVHAVSRDGDLTYLQYASHVEKPVHALQFHPECYRDAPGAVKETGMEILHGFLWHTLHV